ncbi:SpoIIE family protein phosphatase [Streptomyces sp. NPDC057854]|uniref:SpoIIE family protein phosphatase n=1 Tax=unclassified Streptomyces TaxID=2593676 RepID=UPI0036C0AB57
MWPAATASSPQPPPSSPATTPSARYSAGTARPPLPVPLRDGRASLLPPLPGGPGLILGVLPDQPCAAAETPLAKGDTVLLHSDGLTERWDSDPDAARLLDVGETPHPTHHAVLASASSSGPGGRICSGRPCSGTCDWLTHRWFDQHRQNASIRVGEQVVTADAPRGSRPAPALPQQAHPVGVPLRRAWSAPPRGRAARR